MTRDYRHSVEAKTKILTDVDLYYIIFGYDFAGFASPSSWDLTDTVSVFSVCLSVFVQDNIYIVDKTKKKETLTLYFEPENMTLKKRQVVLVLRYSNQVSFYQV